MIQIIQETFINKLEDRFKTTWSGKSKEKLHTRKILLHPFVWIILQENSEVGSFESLKKVSNFCLVNFYAIFYIFFAHRKIYLWFQTNKPPFSFLNVFLATTSERMLATEKDSTTLQERSTMLFWQRGAWLSLGSGIWHRLQLVTI